MSGGLRKGENRVTSNIGESLYSLGPSSQRMIRDMRKVGEPEIMNKI